MPTALLGMAALSLAATTLAACSAAGPTAQYVDQPTPTRAVSQAQPEPTGVVTLAFAGDMHFQLHLAALLEEGSPGLGPMSRELASADVAMVNLESAITERGTLEAKEREKPAERYYYRAPPPALDFLADAGVDVVTMANNHAADYGSQGMTDTLRAARRGPVAVVGVGRDRDAALTPYLTTVGGTDLAILAADASFREGSSSLWAAGRTTPGVAAARSGRPRALLDAVRSAGEVADVVVVYLHWGQEGRACPTPLQQTAARSLAAAGADVVVGSHAHVLLGSGWQGGTYVSYGLGNFLWYHDGEPETGVLRLRIEDGEVVADTWVPARIRQWGRPMPLAGAAARRAVAGWERLRGCAGLGPRPSSTSGGYESSVHRIGPALQEQMGSTHGPRCPLDWHQLRLLRLTHVGFDGRDHTGELVVAARYARQVVAVFGRLYAARWPIRRMRTVDAYGGSDDRSMAADNSSAYNCRTVAGAPPRSDHAYGAAIDLNPVENPYSRAASVSPPAGARFADLDRAPDAVLPRGVIGADDIVVRAFADIGWEWGGTWASPDYQHFSAPEAG